MEYPVIVEIINQFQQARQFHPLVCQLDCSREIMIAQTVDEKIIMKCPKCIYQQELSQEQIKDIVRVHTKMFQWWLDLWKE